jgi:acetylornithine deacetylase/succinyl-diaminopimelate desuccinylase-like protein
MPQLDRSIVDFVCTTATSEGYAAYLRDTLVELVNINTVPDADLAGTAARERQLLDVIEREIKAALGADVVVERPPINPAIANDPDYSFPGYAARDGKAPDVREAYAGRTNLLVVVPGAGGAGPRVIHNAHADVVGPWFGARVEGLRVFGRGACDDKAQIALLLAQMKLFRELEEQLGRKAPGGRVYQFVIEEEMGGNGSLSAALDPRFAGLPVVIHETCGLVPYCGHRGAVWYRCKLAVSKSGAGSAVEIFPFVV